MNGELRQWIHAGAPQIMPRHRRPTRLLSVIAQDGFRVRRGKCAPVRRSWEKHSYTRNFIESINQIENAAHFVGCRARGVVGKPNCFVFEFLSRERVARIAFRLIDSCVDCTAVVRLDRDFSDPAFGVCPIHLRIELHADAMAEIGDTLIFVMLVEFA